MRCLILRDFFILINEESGLKFLKFVIGKVYTDIAKKSQRMFCYYYQGEWHIFFLIQTFYKKCQIIPQGNLLNFFMCLVVHIILLRFLHHMHYERRRKKFFFFTGLSKIYQNARITCVLRHYLKLRIRFISQVMRWDTGIDRHISREKQSDQKKNI